MQIESNVNERMENIKNLTKSIKFVAYEGEVILMIPRSLVI